MNFHGNLKTLLLTSLFILSINSLECLALPPFVLFESGQVRPLALSQDQQQLYAVNTPDNRLEIYTIKGKKLIHENSVPVGLEPVAVAIANSNEVWVTNLLSDSVSIVDISDLKNAYVKKTLVVGDEPRDIVFAGKNNERAFITTAHRGQNIPFDPQLTTPGVGRADVWVFNSKQAAKNETTTPLTIINLFTDTPRALAVSPDKSIVYAAGFQSGNKTTTSALLVSPPVPPSPPFTNFEGRAQPPVPNIVQYNGEHWVDQAQRIFDDRISFNLPDKDVFKIDANANPPRIVGEAFAGVGTVLYNMAVNPVSGKIYVSNTEALNLNRFEGPGDFAGHSVRAHHNLNRISVLSQFEGKNLVEPLHINNHIDFTSCCKAAPNQESTLSQALPMGMQVSKNGKTLYMAAMGSSKVGVFKIAELENASFKPNQRDQIQLSGGGPTGLVLDENRNQMYVLTRFDNAIAIVDLKSRKEISKQKMFNPEPEKIIRGRKFLYDATLSAKGDSACASCHVFGDNDSLSWDLGNPDSGFLPNNHQVRLAVVPPQSLPDEFAPMKGPMATQSLRGMANHGPMHWRGDHTGAYTEINVQPDRGAFNEKEAFRQFQGGFTELVGVPDGLSNTDMEAFSDFILQLMYPPNPIRNLDNSLTTQQQLGRDIYFNRPAVKLLEGNFPCQECHRLNPDANAEFGVEFPGFFGTDGASAREGSSEVFKIAHLRNIYTKVGMFGLGKSIEFAGQPVIDTVPGLEGHQGDQIRGFGFAHSGEFDTVVRFISAFSFAQNTPFGVNPDGFPKGEEGLIPRRAVEAFLFAFDSNLKPIVGQQVTLTKIKDAWTTSRVQLLVDRADAGDCDLVVKGKLSFFDLPFNNTPKIENWRRLNQPVSFLYQEKQFISDSWHRKPLTLDVLRGKVDAAGEALTFTCVPPGSGKRIGIDRDSDGILDSDEI
jgi:DNA-binding beta-propeller fold protein YncE